MGSFDALLTCYLRSFWYIRNCFGWIWKVFELFLSLCNVVNLLWKCQNIMLRDKFLFF